MSTTAIARRPRTPIYPWSTIKEGESLLFPLDQYDPALVRTAGWIWARRRGVKFTFRTEPGLGIRVFRLSKEAANAQA